MNRAAAWLLDLLYPNRCDCCGEPITYDRDICAACAEALEALRCPYEKWAENQTKLLWDGGMTVYAYKEVPLSMGPILESTSYLYITAFGVLIFKEKVSAKKLLALALIVGGICVFALLG